MTNEGNTYGDTLKVTISHFVSSTRYLVTNMCDFATALFMNIAAAVPKLRLWQGIYGSGHSVYFLILRFVHHLSLNEYVNDF